MSRCVPLTSRHSKGFFAFGMQAFCDGDCKFVSISMRACASVHDSTAFMKTALHKIISDHKLPRQYHVVLDEAYVCRDQELSPWRGALVFYSWLLYLLCTQGVSFPRRKIPSTTTCRSTGNALNGSICVCRQRFNVLQCLRDSQGPLGYSLATLGSPFYKITKAVDGVVQASQHLC